MDLIERYLHEQILAKERKVAEIAAVLQKEPASRRENDIEVLEVGFYLFCSFFSTRLSTGRRNFIPNFD
jgi:hypothetical protein